MYENHRKSLLVKQESVNLNHQMIISVIPWIGLYAFYRIQKLRKYLLIMITASIVGYSIILGVFFGTVFQSNNHEEMRSIYQNFLEYSQSIPLNVASIAVAALVDIYLIRKWSKKWNERLELGFSEEISETSEQILRIYVESRWKKPNIYFTLPSIYLFISAGLLVLGTIVKINDSYLFLSITTNLHLIILSIPSIIGATQLWHRKKIGILFSSISLIILSLVLPTSIFWVLQEGHVISNFMSEEMGVIFGSSIGLSILMIYFLFKAKKQVVWNKQFSSKSIDEIK